MCIFGGSGETIQPVTEAEGPAANKLITWVSGNISDCF